MFHSLKAHLHGEGQSAFFSLPIPRLVQSKQQGPTSYYVLHTEHRQSPQETPPSFFLHAYLFAASALNGTPGWLSCESGSEKTVSKQEVQKENCHGNGQRGRLGSGAKGKTPLSLRSILQGKICFLLLYHSHHCTSGRQMGRVSIPSDSLTYDLILTSPTCSEYSHHVTGPPTPLQTPSASPGRHLLS